MVVAAAFGIIFLWLIVLSFVLLKTKAHYSKLVQTTKKVHIDEVLDTLIDKDKDLIKETESLRTQLEEVARKSMTHVQNVNVVRFNPFEKRGREQSFVVSLLDEHVTGLILNFMYTPDGLRVFTKKVKEGKGDGYELSEEEKKSLHG